VYKNVNTITDTVGLVKSKLDKQNTIHHRLADPVLINNFSQTDQIALSNSCGCSCRVLAAELEGVKLELVIMQTNFENKLDSVISRFVDRHTNINQLKHDLSREKEKSNRLQSDLTLLVRETNIEVDELNETIASLQGKISTVEKINDQLRSSNMCINLETANNIKLNHIDEKSVSFNYNSCRTKLAISKQSPTEHQDHSNRTFNDPQVTEFKDSSAPETPEQNGYTGCLKKKATT
jgi:hypothetical protein